MLAPDGLLLMLSRASGVAGAPALALTCRRASGPRPDPGSATRTSISRGECALAATGASPGSEIHSPTSRPVTATAAIRPITSRRRPKERTEMVALAMAGARNAALSGRVSVRAVPVRIEVDRSSVGCSTSAGSRPISRVSSSSSSSSGEMRTVPVRSTLP